MLGIHELLKGCANIARLDLAAPVVQCRLQQQVLFILQQANFPIIGAQHHADHLGRHIIHRLPKHMAARDRDGAVLVSRNLAGRSGLLEFAGKLALTTGRLILFADSHQLSLRRFPLAAGFPCHNAQVYLVEARLIGIFGFQPL